MVKSPSRQAAGKKSYKNNNLRPYSLAAKDYNKMYSTGGFVPIPKKGSADFKNKYLPLLQKHLDADLFQKRYAKML